jgi:hypothetical protein
MQIIMDWWSERNKVSHGADFVYKVTWEIFKIDARAENRGSTN